MTKLGGVFFLIAMLARLDFFETLERHFGVSSNVGGWTWIDLLARALLGRRFMRHATDPIWKCLATLDGRDVPSTIGGFRGVAAYVLPPQWGAHSRLPAIAIPWRQLGMPVPRDLRRFLAFVLPFFRWRLTRALGLTRTRAAVPTLLAGSARVFASATHVDVRFPLDAARPAVRLAGLDANPGWVPALARVVAFEFV